MILPALKILSTCLISLASLSLTAYKISLLSFQEFFAASFLQANLGDTLVLFFQSVYFLRSLNLGYYGGIAMSFFLLLVVIGIIYLIYITIQTLRMKKDMLMMSSVYQEEGEVIEITDDYGKEGWIFIYGENWRFKSKNLLEAGDTVKVIKNKKMNLIVEKVEDIL